MGHREGYGGWWRKRLSGKCGGLTGYVREGQSGYVRVAELGIRPSIRRKTGSRLAKCGRS
jgi:hypothetical protein